MKEFTNIESAVEEAIGQDIGFWLNPESRVHYTHNSSNAKPESLLFFPRKKLKMEKIKSGGWNPRAWFIQDRLDERATGLDVPTDLSQEGLTSGLRSAIVKEPNGTYLRLKGVAPSVYQTPRVCLKEPKHSDIWGLGTLGEAHTEQLMASLLSHIGFRYFSMKPAYIELFIPPVTPNNSQSFIGEYNTLARLPTRFETSHKGSIMDKYRRLTSFSNSAERLHNPHRRSFVSAFEITGDTRLDEALYELTKTELTGDKAKERDEIAMALSFNAGLSLAKFNLGGFAWSAKLDATNSHIGNFVLDRKAGLLQVNLCDFTSVDHLENFAPNEKKDFWNHLYKDIELFKDDFYADYTTSHPTSLRFRHFPEQLRDACFQAFKTGYGIIFHHETHNRREVYPLPPKPERLIVPDSFIIPERTFRERVAYVTSP